MIAREITPTLEQFARQYSVIAILGPRQSGKTTLARSVFGQHRYISFEEALGAQEYAKRDPQGFLDSLSNEHGVILDEFQHVPILLSYIQIAVDKEKKPGYFILTGSQNFLLNERISQSLAGRIALLHLLPFSIKELRDAQVLPDRIETVVYQGCYPRIYDENLDPTPWYTFYTNTYLERDVRQIRNVTDLNKFQKFMQLCAGRTGQVLNVASLSNDADVNVATVNAWLSVLAASYIIFFLQPHHKNFNKRLIKSPKLYFFDTGLVCSLLGIETVEQLQTHYARGSLIETLIISDFSKQYYNKARIPRMYFWRDQTGHEVDCILEQKTHLIPIEIKANKTVSYSFFDDLTYYNQLAHADPSKSFVIYGGNEREKWPIGTILGWQSVDDVWS